MLAGSTMNETSFVAASSASCSNRKSSDRQVTEIGPAPTVQRLSLHVNFKYLCGKKEMIWYF